MRIEDGAFNPVHPAGAKILANNRAYGPGKREYDSECNRGYAANY
jgi:hypothetical protein